MVAQSCIIVTLFLFVFGYLCCVIQICVLGDAKHCEEASANEISSMSVDALKKLNKDKKLVKKLAKKFDAFVASDSVIKQV